MPILIESSEGNVTGTLPGKKRLKALNTVSRSSSMQVSCWFARVTSTGVDAHTCRASGCVAANPKAVTTPRTISGLLVMIMASIFRCGHICRSDYLTRVAGTATAPFQQSSSSPTSSSARYLLPGSSIPAAEPEADATRRAHRENSRPRAATGNPAISDLSVIEHASTKRQRRRDAPFADHQHGCPDGTRSRIPRRSGDLAARINACSSMRGRSSVRKLRRPARRDASDG